MSKLTLTNLANLQNENTAVSTINTNNAAIVTAMDNTLSRDGTLPNLMNSPLDMNSNRIINLPQAIDAAEPVRLKEFNNLVMPAVVPVTIPVSITAGGTGSTTLASARSTLGIINVINTLVLGTSQTYTPSSGMKYILVECVGAGAGGGGCGTSAANVVLTAGGGGAGGYSRKFLTAASAGASQLVSIGVGGAGSPLGASGGSNGSDTAFGSLCIAKGGTGGSPGTLSTNGGSGGAGGILGTGDVRGSGSPGGSGPNNWSGLNVVWNAGNGGSCSPFGSGGKGANGVNVAGNGADGIGYGAGGGGGGSSNGSGTASGGSGVNGVVIITEYCTQ